MSASYSTFFIRMLYHLKQKNISKYDTMTFLTQLTYVNKNNGLLRIICEHDILLTAIHSTILNYM